MSRSSVPGITSATRFISTPVGSTREYRVLLLSEQPGRMGTSLAAGRGHAYIISLDSDTEDTMGHAVQTEMKGFIAKLNGPWHAWALRTFTLIVLAHWAEHVVQAYQVYQLGWPLHQARGVLGQAFPWLVHSEVLHYGYAVIMLAGIWMLLPGFVGRSRTWWVVVVVVLFWLYLAYEMVHVPV